MPIFALGMSCIIESRKPFCTLYRICNELAHSRLFVIGRHMTCRVAKADVREHHTSHVAEKQSEC